MSPRVSIVMPVYNVAPYLEEAVESILNQTFGDFEFIILNDCSPDNSEEILNNYSDKRIVRYKGEKNVGFANVLNIGIKMARGEFIARMDSDDISLPRRIETLVNFLDEHPEVDLVSAGIQQFGTSERVFSFTTNAEEVKFNAMSYSPILHASSMWRRDRFLNNELFYKQEMVPSEDYDLWTRALCKGLVLVNIPDILYLYRSHPSQVTSVNKDWSKNTIIKSRYLQTIFPGISEKHIRDFTSLMEINDPVRVDSICKDLESLNDKVCFFDKSFLKSKLRRYYQARLFNDMKSNGIKWRSIIELRPSQIFKLLTTRSND